MVVGHPMKINAPIIKHIPRTNLVNGAEPPLTTNSLRINEMTNTPNIKPGISGLMYCPLAKPWNPRAPEMSRRNQAVQNPRLKGLPIWERTASTKPKASPKIGNFNFLVIFLPPMYYLLTLYNIKKVLAIFFIDRYNVCN